MIQYYQAIEVTILWLQYFFKVFEGLQLSTVIVHFLTEHSMYSFLENAFGNKKMLY